MPIVVFDDIMRFEETIWLEEMRSSTGVDDPKHWPWMFLSRVRSEGCT